MFNLNNASNWHCTVMHLAPGHGTLDIQLIEPNSRKVMKLQFHQVFYFGGWTKWQGANFRFSTALEHIELARRDSNFDHVPDEDILHTGIFNISKFFVCQSKSQGLIYIMASGGYLYDKSGTEIISHSVLG